MNFTAVLPILSLIAGIVVSLLLGIPLALGIVFAILVTLVNVKKRGYGWKQQFAFGWSGVRQTKPVLVILLLVGLLIPLLMMGGTIPAIIYYGLSAVNVDYLVVISFLLSAAVSYVLGTSVGTLSTVGLSLMGIAHAAAISPAMVAGALISGAMVGERFSPISSSRLLILAQVGITEEQDRIMRKPALWTAGLCAILFVALDLFRSDAESDSTIPMYQELLLAYFPVGVVPLLPIIVLIASFAFRTKAVKALLAGVVAAAFLVVLNGPIDVARFLAAVWNGYELQSGTRLDELVHGGGLASIASVLLLIVLAGFLTGILKEANLLTPLVERMLGQTRSSVVLVAKSVALSLLVVIVSCNQTIPILVMGSTLIRRFSRLPRGKELLGRTMLDSTLVMPVLIPWNGLAMVFAVSLGVSTLASLPFVLYALLLPLVTIFSSRRFWTGDGYENKSIDSEQEVV